MGKIKVPVHSSSLNFSDFLNETYLAGRVLDRKLNLLKHPSTYDVFWEFFFLTIFDETTVQNWRQAMNKSTKKGNSNLVNRNQWVYEI